MKNKYSTSHKVVFEIKSGMDVCVASTALLADKICAALNFKEESAVRERKLGAQIELRRLLDPIYFESIPFEKISAICVKYGFNAPEFAFTNSENGSIRYHEDIGEGIYLTMTTYRMKSGRFEVVGYIS